MNPMSARFVRKILNSLSNAILTLPHLPEVQKFSSIFQRKRKLPLVELIRFLLLLNQDSIPLNLRHIFPNLKTRPTPAAICKRRNLLAPEILENLLYLLNRKLDSITSSRSLYYRKKYRLLACDGSDVSTMNNPNDQDSYFSSPNGTGYNMYHVNTLFDLITKRYTQVVIHPKRCDNERASFLEMAKYYANSSNIIFMMDRGYECWDIVVSLCKTKNYFLMRVKGPESSGNISSLSCPQQDRFDIERTVYLVRGYHPSKKSLLHPDGYAYRRTENETKADTVVKVRILSFPIAGGNNEYLMTNLPAEKFGSIALKRLYHKRWGIETSFRDLKLVLDAVALHSKQQKKIIQELWASLIMFNVCSAVREKLHVKKEQRIYKYKVSFRLVADECRIYFIQRGDDPDFIENIISSLSPIRPGRASPRKVKKSQGPRCFQYR